jgi:PAT family beta-lactamase induction signal transducer AmpG
MASLMLVGMATVWLTPEPAETEGAAPIVGNSAAERLKVWLGRAVLAPFADLVRRYGAAGLGLILIFTVLYKLGEAVAGTMSNPLYVLLGFTKVEIATVAKIYGVAATLAGVAAGGILVARLGVLRALLVSGVLQMLSNLMYVVQVWAGHDVFVLSLTIGAENLTNGMGSAAFVAYLSGLCNLAFTATQYALLTSLASVGLNVLSASGGFLADQLGWVPFFLIATAACLPGLALLLWIIRWEAAAER